MSGGLSADRNGVRRNFGNNPKRGKAPKWLANDDILSRAPCETTLFTNELSAREQRPACAAFVSKSNADYLLLRSRSIIIFPGFSEWPHWSRQLPLSPLSFPS